MNTNSNEKTSNVYEEYFSDISHEAKTNLSEMNVEKLKEMLNKKDIYSDKMLEYIQYLINVKSDNQSDTANNCNKNFTYKQQTVKNNRKINTTVVVMVCCTVMIILTIFLAMFIVNYNNEKQERLSAIERIDLLCDELYRIENFGSTEAYYKAQDKLKEIKELLDKYEIEDLSLEKYKDVSSYITDLKIYEEMLAKLYAPTRIEVRNFHRNAEKIKNEKITSKISAQLPILAEQAKKIILMNSFYDAQQYIINKHPGAQITNTVYYTGESLYSLWHKRTVTNYCVNFVISSPEKFGDILHDSIDVNENALEKIDNNGKKGIIVTYNKEDQQGWCTSWPIGYDVEAYYSNGCIMYKVTKYNEGKAETKNMTIDELLYFGLTPA